MKNLSRIKSTEKNTKKDFQFLDRQDEYFKNGFGTIVEKLDNFPKYVSRQSLAYFLAKYEIFKQILSIQGSIVECGVYFGGGFMTFAQLSAIFEPVNYQRRIIGFDTFSGFPQISDHEKTSTSEFAHKGGLKLDSYSDLKKCIELYDSNRSINHLSKAQLIKGDATKTIPDYLKKNPQTIVSLLYLDFDLYEPTKIAIENFLPRMPKGSIIVFDELNAESWPGETEAVLDTIGISKLKIQRPTFNPYPCYAVIGS